MTQKELLGVLHMASEPRQEQAKGEVLLHSKAYTIEVADVGTRQQCKICTKEQVQSEKDQMKLNTSLLQGSHTFTA